MNCSLSVGCELGFCQLCVCPMELAESTCTVARDGTSWFCAKLLVSADTFLRSNMCPSLDETSLTKIFTD